MDAQLESESTSRPSCQAQSSVPDLPSCTTNFQHVPPKSATPSAGQTGHRRRNSFSGRVDDSLISWGGSNSIGLLEIATHLLRNAPAALCGAQFTHEDELYLPPPQNTTRRLDFKEGEKDSSVFVSEAVLTQGSPSLRGRPSNLCNIDSSEENVSLPEDEAYSSAPSTYRSSTSMSECDHFSSRSCIFTHSRTSSMASSTHPYYQELPHYMTHVRKASDTSVQSAPAPLVSHPLECAILSNEVALNNIFKVAGVDTGSQETLKGAEGSGQVLEGEGGVSSGGENDLSNGKSVTEKGTKRKKKSKAAKFEDPLVRRGLKSVEWIKQNIDDEKDPLVQVKVSSKTKHVVHFNVKRGDIVIWQFATKKRDIGFGILFESTEVEKEETPSEKQNDAGDTVLHILPILRVPSHSYMIEGSHKAPSDGFYIIAWDNYFSRFFAKDLYYRITTQSSSSTIPPTATLQDSSDLPVGTGNLQPSSIDCSVKGPQGSLVEQLESEPAENETVQIALPEVKQPVSHFLPFTEKGYPHPEGFAIVPVEHTLEDQSQSTPDNVHSEELVCTVTAADLPSHQGDIIDL